MRLYLVFIFNIKSYYSFYLPGSNYLLVILSHLEVLNTIIVQRNRLQYALEAIEQIGYLIIEIRLCSLEYLEVIHASNINIIRSQNKRRYFRILRNDWYYIRLFALFNIEYVNSYHFLAKSKVLVVLKSFKTCTSVYVLGLQ